MFYLNIFGNKYACSLFKFICIFGGIITYCSVFGATSVHIGVAGKIVFQTFGYILTLRYNLYAFGNVLFYFRHKNGIVCATQYERIDVGV